MATVNLPLTVGEVGSWVNTGNIFAQDGAVASAVISSSPNYSDLGLSTTNTVPAGATITDVTLTVIARTSAAGASKLVPMRPSFFPYIIWDLTTTLASYSYSFGTTIPGSFYLEAQHASGGSSTTSVDYAVLTVTYTPGASAANALLLGDNF